MATVYIPLARSHEVLAVKSHEISEDIVRVLINERASPDIWLECARVFLQQGRLDSYTRLLTTLISELPRWRGSGSSTRFAQVRAMCALADVHVQQASAADDAEAKRREYNAANRLYFEAQRVDHMEMLPHLGLGQAALAMGDISTARREFENASRLRCNGQTNIAGTLALARLAFTEGDVTMALDHYRRALAEHPSCPAEVRLGIAACYFRRGEVDKAELAYKRVMDLYPSCTQALLGLAILELSAGMNKSESEAQKDAKQRGSSLLAQAFQADPYDPRTLVLLAHFSLIQGFESTTSRLAQVAMDKTSPDERQLLAEATCLLGRAHHASGALAEAIVRYQQALALQPNMPTARYALSQMAILKGDISSATAGLEAVLEQHPALVDALKLLAPLILRVQGDPARLQGVASHLKDALHRNKDDAQLWEMYGDALAGTDPSTALSAYTEAIALHRRTNSRTPSGHPLPARLLNNAAVLQLRAGNVSTASSLVHEALASAAHGGLSELGPQAQVTLGYNAARIQEASGDVRAAENEYKALLAEFPSYTDCLLRLASIARARGDIPGAEEWAKKAAEVSGRSADAFDALALLAGLHLQHRDLNAADKCLKELQNSVPAGAMSHETYARLASANVHLYSLPGDLKKAVNGKYSRQEEADTLHKAELHLGHALSLYRRVLSSDPHNIFAANGIGCVLAEAGRLEEAKDVFLRVQEAAAGSDGFFRLPDVWVNLANVYAGLRQFGAAEKTYINAMKRFPEARDPRMQLYLARAQYEGGNGPAALRTLQKTLHASPSDPRLLFNIAYVLQQLADGYVRRTDWKSEDIKAVSLRKAVTQLGQAHSLFKALLAAGPLKTGVQAKVLDQHLVFVSERHQVAASMAEMAEQQARIAEARRKEQRLLLESEALKRQAEEKRQEAEKEALERAREAVARETAAKLERLKEEWKHGASLAKAAAAGDVSGVPTRDELAGRGRSEADAALEALFGTDDDEEDYEYVPGQEDDGGDGGGDVGVGGGGGEERQTMARKVEDGKGGDEKGISLAAAGLLSSDEDEEKDKGDGGGTETTEPRKGYEVSGAPAGKRLVKRGRHDEESDQAIASPMQGLLEDDTEAPVLQDDEVEKKRRRAMVDDEDDGNGLLGGAPLFDDSD